MRCARRWLQPAAQLVTGLRSPFVRPIVGAYGISPDDVHEAADLVVAAARGNRAAAKRLWRWYERSVRVARVVINHPSSRRALGLERPLPRRYTDGAMNEALAS